MDNLEQSPKFTLSRPRVAFIILLIALTILTLIIVLGGATTDDLVQSLLKALIRRVG